MAAITEIKGVGGETAARLSKIGVESVEDLLFHFPLRYQDRTRTCPITQLQSGREALVEGRVRSVGVVYARRRMLVVKIEDAGGTLQLRFFYFSAAQRAGFQAGRRICVYGEVRRSRSITEIIHPEYRFITEKEAVPVSDSHTPVYPTTEGLLQKSLFKLTSAALEWLEQPGNGLEELLPPEVVRVAGDIPLKEAIRIIHRPPPGTDVRVLSEGDHPARRRLVFEELLANILSLKRLRASSRRHQALSLKCDGQLFDKLTARLPFALTPAQHRVVGEIRADLEQPLPMMRLVQGDVGSGKTLVAAAAMLHAIECGFQAALMAPTEILAEQHSTNLRELLEPLNIRVGAVLGRQRTREKRSALGQIRRGNVQLAVGTHALFQESVGFSNLALIVVDEQHRFGVHQRLLLKEKGERGEHQIHQLIMTATPIPRSLAMTMYADLDYSVIDVLPPGRRHIRTIALPDRRRDEVIGRVREACAKGAQAYWVCTLIEESESLQCRAAEDSFRDLKAAMPELRLGMVHGNLNSQQKEAAMHAFKAGELDLLVATTVIEVGVDVPNATLMVIENSERLGLAQLHQLRGRVGRSSKQSTCVLMYRMPLPEKAARRIQVLRNSGDGFEIAREDMRLRGPGEILGTRQTGQMCFRVADLSRDAGPMQDVLKIAEGFLKRHPETADRLIDRWLGRLAKYAEV